MTESSNGSIKLLDPNGSAWVILALTTISTVFGFFGSYYWFFDLFSHWRAQYAWLGLLTTLFYSVKKKRAPATLAFLLLLTNLSYIAPLYFSPPNQSQTQPKNSVEIKIAQINLCAQHKETKAAVNYLKSNSFDILSMVELTPHWEKALSEVQADYPYRVCEPREDCFGICLWSKLPIKDHKIVAYVSKTAPSIEATLVVNEGPITVIVTHALPPRSSLLSHFRDEQFIRMGKRKNSYHKDIILLGDLNNTPWSPSYRQLENSLQLHNARQGFGICASWPTVGPPLLIPIDHCLVSHRIKVSNCQLGPSIGSDHYPLEVTLAIPAP